MVNLQTSSITQILKKYVCFQFLFLLLETLNIVIVSRFIIPLWVFHINVKFKVFQVCVSKNKINLYPFEFPVIHKVGNVVNFVLFSIEG